MPMGALNSMSVFVAMMDVIQAKWKALVTQRNISRASSKVIVNDVLLYAETPEILLQFLECVLETLKHFWATVKLKKCKWFQPHCEFVGVDLTAQGNSPATSKHQAFDLYPRGLDLGLPSAREPERDPIVHQKELA